MALKPDTNFAGKINPATSAYPYGSARNVTTQDDGTGTPFIDLLINDNFGWQQALLDEAGIVPSGSPDSKTTSQYLDAWKSLFYENSKIADRNALSGNAVFTDTTQFATGTTKDGVLSDSTLLALVGTTTKCRTEGFHAGTTVGGDFYKILNGTDKSNQNYIDGKTAFQLRGLDAYACLVGNVFKVKVESFGFVNDGVTDNSSSLTALLAFQRGKRVGAQWGSGKYLINSGAGEQDFYFYWEGQGLDTEILWQPSSDEPLFKQILKGSSPSYDLGDEGTLNGAEICSLVIKGNRSQLCSGIAFEQCDKMKLENIYVYGIKGTALDLDSCREYTLDGVRTRYNGDRLNQRPDVRLHSDNPAQENNNFAHIRGCFFIYPLWSNLVMDNCSAMSISGGLMLHAIPLGTVYAGSHDGADNASTLSDSSKTFPDLTGKIVRNITDGSQGVITSNTSTTITATLSGGTDNDWDIGDEYAVQGDQESSVKIYYNNLFGNTNDIDDWYDNWYKSGGGIDSNTLRVTGSSTVQSDHIKSYAGGKEPVYISDGRFTCSDFLLNGSDKKNGADFCVVADNSAIVKLSSAYANNTQQIFDERNSAKVAIDDLTRGSAIGATQVLSGDAVIESRGSRSFYCSDLIFHIEDGNGNSRILDFTQSGNNVRIDPNQGVVFNLSPEPFNSSYVVGDIWSQNGGVRTHTDNGTKYLGTKTVVPASASSTGRIGDWAVDSSYVYFYTGDGVTHSWVRSAVSTW